MAAQLKDVEPVADKGSDEAPGKSKSSEEKQLSATSEDYASDSDSDVSDDIEVSDSEDYVPPDTQSDESESSGDEEVGVRSEEVLNTGECKLYKLKFDEVEAKRKERLEKMAELDSDSDEEENKENISEGEGTSHGDGKKSYSDYRAILDEDMGEYASENDDDFNPLSCEETLTDEEYQEGDEHDTESEPEVDDLNEKHKKTGETLKCIRMIEKLNIPPMDSSPSKIEDESSDHSAMECS